MVKHKDLRFVKKNNPIWKLFPGKTRRKELTQKECYVTNYWLWEQTSIHNHGKKSTTTCDRISKGVLTGKSKEPLFKKLICEKKGKGRYYPHIMTIWWHIEITELFKLFADVRQITIELPPICIFKNDFINFHLADNKGCHKCEFYYSK